jgi:hypothetical protein
VRDEPVGEVFRVRERKIAFAGETWTEVLVNDVHDSAGRQLSARRLGDYLGSELRGQLLERGVKLRIVDRTARGRALKDFLVTPKRYRGRRLLDIADLAVPGFSRARLEIYHAGQETTEAAGPRPAIALTCGGVVVCDDLAAIEGREFDRAPWNLGVYEGVVEFPDLEVSPATRRGFSPGPAADAIFEALRTVEPELLRVAEIERERRRVEEDESLARDLKRVFRPLVRNLPQYEFFDVRTQGSAGVTRSSPEVGEAMGSSPSDDSAPGDPAGPRSGGEAEDDASEAASDDDTKDTDTPDDTAGEAPPPPPESEIIESGDMPEPPAEVLPPGPLAELRISPRRSRLLRSARRELSARPVDTTGRTIERTMDIEWTLAEGPGLLAAEGCRATFVAPDELGVARILARAVEGDRSAEAEATVEIVETLMGGQRDAGIPSPRRAFDPSGDWRSRMRGRRWEYNAAHPDYRAVVDDPRRRFRYLVHLLAKEIVLRNYGEPKDERILERVVEVLTHIHPRG